MKKKNLILLILLFSFVGLLYINNKKNIASTKNIILTAYTEGVLSGADITFYDNFSMKYCSVSLFNEKCYSGKYELIKDTFYVKYSNQITDIVSTKMIQSDNKLLFLNEKNEIVNEFYLDDKYINNINSDDSD